MFFNIVGSAIEFLILGSAIEYLIFVVGSDNRQNINFLIEEASYGQKYTH